MAENEYDDFSQQPQQQPMRPMQQGYGMQPQRPMPQPQQQQMPMPILPWGQQDDTRVARLQAGLRAVEDDAIQGTIDRPRAQAATAQIHSQLQPLLTRQQQHQTQQQQKAVQQLMQQEAMGFSIQQLHAVKEAQGTQEAVGVFVDPITGSTLFRVPKGGKGGGFEVIKANELLPDEPGSDTLRGFEEQLRDSQGRPAPGGEGTSAEPQTQEREWSKGQGFRPAGAVASADPLAGAGAGEEESTPAHEPVSLESVAAKMTGQSSGVPHATPASPTAGPRILNASGQDITDQQQQAYDQTKSLRRDEWGRPLSGQGGTPGDLLGEAYRRADAAVPKLPPGAHPALQVKRAEQVQHLAGLQMQRQSIHAENQHKLELHRLSIESEHQARRETQRHQSQLAQETNRQKDADRAAEHKRQEQQKKEGVDKESLAHRSQERRHIMESMDKKIMHYEKEIPRKDWPKWMETPESREDEGERVYQQHMKSLGVGAESKKPTGISPDAQKMLDLVKKRQQEAASGQTPAQETGRAAGDTSLKKVPVEAQADFAKQVEAMRQVARDIEAGKKVESSPGYGRLSAVPVDKEIDNKELFKKMQEAARKLKADREAEGK